MVVDTPVMPVEDGSPHAPGAIQTKRCTYRESSKSSKSIIGLFCLFGMVPEFRLTNVSENVCPLLCKKANWLLLRGC